MRIIAFKTLNKSSHGCEDTSKICIAIIVSTYKIIPIAILEKSKFSDVEKKARLTNVNVQLRAKQTAPLVNKHYENEVTLR